MTRVLVVDDDPDMRALISDCLQHGGLEVVEEPGGDRIVSGADPEPFDVAIVDKELPGITGLDLLSFLRCRYPDAPVILITAFGGARVAAEAFDRGATRYLEKPFRMSELLAVVQSVVAERTALPHEPR